MIRARCYQCEAVIFAGASVSVGVRVSGRLRAFNPSVVTSLPDCCNRVQATSAGQRDYRACVQADWSVFYRVAQHGLGIDAESRS